MSLSIRWLGAAGLEISCDGTVLLVDPFFTRPSIWAVLLLRRVEPDSDLAARCAPRASAVLVTHPHYDHLMDVPAIMRQTGAAAYGSPNTCALLALHGVHNSRIHCVQPGDRFAVGPFQVEVLAGRHTTTPVDRWINGPCRGDLSLPLRLVDYRMDAVYSFRIHVRSGGSEQTLLVGSSRSPGEQADVLFLSPFLSKGELQAQLQAVQPRCLIPIHWDDFTRPLSKPMRPSLITAVQGLEGFPPVRRVDLSAFAHTAQSLQPGLRVLVPEAFKIINGIQDDCRHPESR
ncbi:MAG: MBL fold metallo-hydrolase [Chloroflexi bacterium]|nr:MBL fold metallo-hydrolase [Chloroflexota bacterium]